MEIKANEIDSIKSIGELNGKDLKLIKTLGGLYVAVGSKTKLSKTMEPIATGSHPALISHQIEKEYNKEYRPLITKSEHEVAPQIEDFTKKLSVEMVDKSFALFSVKKNEIVNFIATKQGAEIVNFEGEVTDKGFIISKTSGGDVLETMNKDGEIDKICGVIANVIKDKYGK